MADHGPAPFVTDIVEAATPRERRVPHHPLDRARTSSSP